MESGKFQVKIPLGEIFAQKNSNFTQNGGKIVIAKHIPVAYEKCFLAGKKFARVMRFSVKTSSVVLALKVLRPRRAFSSRFGQTFLCSFFSPNHYSPLDKKNLFLRIFFFRFFSS